MAEESSLKPYWGKPTVRNFRGGEGNVSMVWRLFATTLERADTTEADQPKLGAPSLYSVVTITIGISLTEKIPKSFKHSHWQGRATLSAM
jgi:hypothetical protein